MGKCPQGIRITALVSLSLVISSNLSFPLPEFSLSPFPELDEFDDPPDFSDSAGGYEAGKKYGNGVRG